VSFLLIITTTTFLFKSQKQKNTIEIQNSNLLRQKMLLSQMNPHFVFNSINSIQSFILDKKEKEAYSYLAKFSKLIRMVLNNSEELVIPLFQEIDLLKTYIELEQLRFENSFALDFFVEDDLNIQSLVIPPMLIQPYVENAIWHGLMNLKEARAGKLSVKFTSENNLLKVIVEDNGIGRVKAGLFEKDLIHRPIAMKLTQKRLQIIHKTWGQNGIKVNVYDLHDQNENATGTRVEVFLPLDFLEDERF
ncbi:MAG: sensor histidine kinase, partial [Nitrososphaeraceae archaeon]